MGARVVCEQREREEGGHAHPRRLRAEESAERPRSPPRRGARAQPPALHAHASSGRERLAQLAIARKTGTFRIVCGKVWSGLKTVCLCVERERKREAVFTRATCERFACLCRRRIWRARENGPDGAKCVVKTLCLCADEIKRKGVHSFRPFKVGRCAESDREHPR